jgi:hypothetical protein
MNKAQKEACFQCMDARCRYFNRCAIYWGSRCNRQGGKKIPRIIVVKR